jgi:hypothetical protein
MAKTSNDMINSGLKIPAPINHSKDAVPKLSTVDTPDPYQNAGYWKKFWVSDEEGVPTLYGIVDAPGDPEDLNTPAGKIGKTMQECSVSVRPEFTDGKNRVWKNDPILHVAICTHPVDYGTSNFELADKGDISLSLSTLVNSPGEDSLQTLRTKLAEVANIFLPEACSMKDLVPYLLTSLNQLSLTKKASEKDDGNVIEPSPVFLSTNEVSEMALTQAQAQSIVDSGATNPVTGKPYGLADLGFGKQPEAPKTDPNIDQLLSFSKAVSAKLVKDQQNGLTRRINALVDSGRTTREYADKALLPQVATVQLSFVNGEIAQPPVECVVEALEALPAPKKQGTQLSLPTGTTVHNPDDDTNNELSDEEANKLADQLLSYL